MADFKHDPGNGNIFINTSEHPKAPKLSGKFTGHDGKVWEIALWTATDLETKKPKLDKNGKRFYSVRVTEPRARIAPTPIDVDDDDIPF